MVISCGLSLFVRGSSPFFIHSEAGLLKVLADRAENSKKLIGPAVIVLAHVPLAAVHVGNLWRHGKFLEFLMLCLIAAICWVWALQPLVADGSRLMRWLGLSLLLVGWACLTGGVVWWLPRMAWVAAALCGGGVRLLRSSRAAWRELLPAGLMLWLVVAPPFHPDALLPPMLQHVTASIISPFLETIGIRHFLTGELLQLSDRELSLVEVADGGSRLLVLLAAAALLAIARRRTWLHTVLLELAAFFWSCLMDVLHVVAVAFAADQFGVDSLSSWSHLGLASFALVAALLLLWNTDCLLRGLLAAVLFYNIEYQGEQNAHGDVAWCTPADDPLSRFWNRFIAVHSGVTAMTATDSHATTETPEKAGKPIPATLSMAFFALAVMQLCHVFVVDSRVSVLQLPDRSCAKWSESGIVSSSVPARAGYRIQRCGSRSLAYQRLRPI